MEDKGLFCSLFKKKKKKKKKKEEEEEEEEEEETWETEVFPSFLFMTVLTL